MFRTLLTSAAFLAALTGAACAADTLDPNDASDTLTISRKIMCSTEDGKATTYSWEGRAYSRRMGQRDKLLFLVEGMNIRACSEVSDPEKGKGFKLVSREILLYKDPKTGEVLSTWDNPWSGETVDVLHVANDPVNFTMYETGRDGNPAKWSGVIHDDLWYQSTTVPLFYPNPLASEFQAEIGGTYHATEMFNFFGDATSLLDPSTDQVPVHVSWERMSDWLPWMKMGGRDGIIYFHTAGRKLKSWDDLSDTMQSEIRKHYPEYDSAPPLDDPRRNITSWKYYKQVADGEVEAPKR
jgi:hypothetical protein